MIKYSIHQDPPRPDGKPTARHLRTVDLKPVDNDELAHAMHEVSPIFTAGTNIGALGLLARTLTELLAKGAAVTIEDLGTFQPRIEGDVEDVASRGGVRTRISNLRVGSVEFRPDPEFLEAINRQARFEHVLETRCTDIPDAELTAFLAAHFATHPRLLRSQLESHFHLSKRRSLTLLAHLVDAGRLRRKGTRGNMWYVMAE